MEALPQRQNCCDSTCQDVVTVAVPGPQGPAGQNGAPGTNGTNGISAFTHTTAAFTMPAVSSSVTVSVGENRFMAVGMLLQIENCGYLFVSALPGGVTTSVTLVNAGTAGNVIPGTSVPSGSLVCPSIASSISCAPDDAYYWLRHADTDLPNGVALDTTNGYLKLSGGTGIPAGVNQIPDEDIEYDEQNLGTGTTINWNTGFRVFYKYLTENAALTFSNEVGGKQILVIVRQNTTTAYSCSFTPTTGTIRWAGGTAPNLASVSLGSYNVFSFVKSKTADVIIGTALTNAY